MFLLRDFLTKQPVVPSNFVFTGENGPWEVAVDLKQVTERINPNYFRTAPPFVSKYLPLMPIKDFSNFISLQEGATPLIKSKRIGKDLNIDLYFKLEGQNPTGSFKDRGSAVELTIARELNVKGISVASTGNMAASCSCYAASAHIPCFLFVPEDTPPSKLSQAISYGGRIVQVKGSYNDAAQLAREVAEEFNFYLAGDYAYRVEGQKTAAFELCDQMFFRVPDMVVIPIGCGTNVTAYYKGFCEYRELGFIDRIPRVIGVQAEGAASVVNAYRQNSRTVEKLDGINTLASAIAVTFPLDGVKALDAIYGSEGSAIAVSDREILEAQYLLSKEEGLFVESSSATTLASLMKMSKDRRFEGQEVVCILTGGGLKDPSPILKIAVKPPTIYPDVNEFKTLYDSAFFEGRSVAFTDKEQIVISTPPTKEKISSLVRKFFGTAYSDHYVESIREVVEKILKKGKPVTFADFQDIVQEVLESVPREASNFLKVEDFRVETSKDHQASAWVKVLVDGVPKEARAQGVGPVDAVTKALKAASAGELDFSLSGFRVDIRSEGTDALVYVEIKLIKDKTVSLGKGTSPDILQASIEAFVEGYNSFRQKKLEVASGPVNK